MSSASSTNAGVSTSLVTIRSSTVHLFKDFLSWVVFICASTSTSDYISTS
jgi:hypothetical protein